MNRSGLRIAIGALSLGLASGVAACVGSPPPGGFIVAFVWTRSDGEHGTQAQPINLGAAGFSATITAYEVERSVPLTASLADPTCEAVDVVPQASYPNQFVDSSFTANGGTCLVKVTADGQSAILTVHADPRPSP
jgi:hypothetical protein